MEDTMKIARSLKNSVLLNDMKIQSAEFFFMLLLTLGPSLLGNMLAGKGIVIAINGIIRAGDGVFRAGQDF